MSPVDRLRQVVLGCSCLLVCGVAGAASGVLAGSLGHWLDSQAAPALAEKLSRHPRFKGETIRVVGMRDGKPAAISNGLAQAVQQRLTRELLRASGVRIAWGNDHQDCKPPRQIPLLLGIEIESAGAGQHRLHLGVVDVEEGLWVSGVSHTWKGRLSTAAKAALRETVQVGMPGSVENPLRLADRKEVGEMLRLGLRCALPSGLQGPVFIETAAQSGLDSVSRSLASDLSKTSLTSVTTDRDAAAWIVQLRARPAGAVHDAVHELVLMLRDASGERAMQQLASVMVTGIAAPIADPPRAAQGIADATLIGPLQLREADGKGICHSDDAGDGCVEVGFRLNQPAYVLVLSSESRRLSPGSCARGVRQSEPGERWFRVRVAPGTEAAARPDAGFYVLAIKQRNIADGFAAHLNRLCSPSRNTAHLPGWLAELDRLVQRGGQLVDWRSMHLSRTPTGIARL